MPCFLPTPRTHSRFRLTHLAAAFFAVVAVTAGAAEQKAAAKPANPEDALTFVGAAAAPANPLALWWRTPARAWNEGMPLGNGRLGVMAAGGVCQETLWLNEDTLWSGEPFEVPNDPAVREAFLEIRKLMAAGKHHEAAKLYNQKMIPSASDCYLPLGTLTLDFPIGGEVRDYRRDLNLRTGVATVRFVKDGATHTRETFVSHPDQAVVIRLGADRPGLTSFSASIASLLENQVAAQDGVLRMTGRCPAHANSHGRFEYDKAGGKGMTFATEIRVASEGGKVSVADGKITAQGCDSVTLILSAATSFNGVDKSPSAAGRDPLALCKAQGVAAANKDYAALRRDHTADFSALMDRVKLDLGTTPAAARPINERLRAGCKKEDVPALSALFYQFGRYLLVSSSRPGSQPATLQGIWTHEKIPPWASNWTMNCNAELNYLGCEAANLSDLHEPFIRLVKEWSVDGARAAKNVYGCRGWVGQHNCDLWRHGGPIGFNADHAAFIGGGGWVCQNLWEHYAFTGDKAYLADVWPVLRGSAEFYLDYLREDPATKRLVAGPDNNFENSYENPRLGKGLRLCDGSTSTTMIIRQVFLNGIEASKILDTDVPLRARMEEALARLAPTVVSPRDGEIEEFADPGSRLSERSLSELLTVFGIAWCDQITPRKTPALAAAMLQAYEAKDRQPWRSGQVATWWGGMANNTLARLGRGDHVAGILAALFHSGYLAPNFTGDFYGWQIDTNLGNMAAIGETLMQSHAGEIELLPALPPAWSSGQVTGLRARGGFETDITWNDGKLTRATIRSIQGTVCTVRYGERTVKLDMQPGESKTLAGAALGGGVE